MTDQNTNTQVKSCAAEHYGLSESNDDPILVYHRHGKHHYLETSSQRQLCQFLDQGTKQTLTGSSSSIPTPSKPSLQVTKKQIHTFDWSVEIEASDLWPPELKEAYLSSYPNQTGIASISIPFKAFCRRVIFGTYDYLYIVSPRYRKACGADS